MEKIDCKNCKYYNNKRSAILKTCEIDRLLTYPFCSDYKRKWWKFWA